MLGLEEFQILYRFFQKSGGEHDTQRSLAQALSVSLGKTNQLINGLLEKRLILVNEAGKYEITADGMEALEPYRVQNAIIMAAGMSSRFAPLSYEKPKGLLKVKGEVLIEREIRQLKEAGIQDITIVVGYMQEKFFYLEDKFGVKIVVNEDYYQYNNTSTLIRVLDRLSNTFICSSDNYFVDNVFEPYVYRSYYAAVYAPGDTDEYCIECDGKGKIKQVVSGGRASWFMMGHVYFDRFFSEAFGQLLAREYKNPEVREHYWEDLYIRHIRNLDMYIRKYDADKVLEFDSLDELREFDAEYINNADSKILTNISQVLGCETGEIVNIKVIKTGMTNTSFQFQVGEQCYVYRHPQKGSRTHINRKSEAASSEMAAKLHLDDSYLYMDSKDGWRISHYIHDTHTMDYHNETEVSAALSMIRTLHEQQLSSEYEFNIWEKTSHYYRELQESGYDDFDDFKKLHELVASVYERTEQDAFPKCLCHCTCQAEHFLVDDENRMYLVDWEYSGNDDPASDFGTFICWSDYSNTEVLRILEEYLEHTPNRTEQGHYFGYVSITAYYWYLWTLYQEMNGNHLGKHLYSWYQYAKTYASYALQCYEREAL